MLIAERARQDLAPKIHFSDAQQIRYEIAQVTPSYDGIQHLKAAGDQVQWGGPRLFETYGPGGEVIIKFETASGRAEFSQIHLEGIPSNGKFRLATRRGKQFNSMVHEDLDALTGARRDDVLISRADADALGLEDGDPIMLRGETGCFSGRCKISPIAPGNLQVHWPEGNVLLSRGIRDPQCGMPDYNTVVTIERSRT
jgi:predicted molibdopterin-dependent oxidoreductase YjgC